METAPIEKAIAPHDLRAEISVLGSMLLSPDAMEYCLELLLPDDFYDIANKEIFASMRDVRNGGIPCDEVALIYELNKKGKLRAIGDAGYISDLIMQTPSAANVGHYAKIVSEKSIQRRLIRAGNAISIDGANPNMPIEQMLNDAERRIYDIAISKAEDTLMPIRDIVEPAFTHLESLRDNKGKTIGVPTGFYDLDDRISGLKKSDLIIVAGRPSMGKTSLAINIAQHAALKEHKTVAVFSLEMAKEQLLLRMFSTESKVDLQKILTGSTTEKEYVEIALHLSSFQNSKLYVDDSANATVPAIRSKCRRLKSREGLDLVVVDYLQLMRSAGKTENRQQEISEITRSFKILARELDVPIVLLSQLSRAPEQRKDDHRPMLSDLRESGAIEQDADIVMLLYREKVYDEEADNTAEVIIAKHRNGPTGTVKLYWRGEYTRFENQSRN